MTTNGSPFLLGPVGAMVPVDATPGVTLTRERPRSASVSGAGVRRTRRGRYAPRTWEMSLADVTPEVVTMLELAAQGMVGDVWLLDRADAAANMLAPHQVGGADRDRVRVPCGGMSLASITPGPSQTRTLRVRASANAALSSSTPDASWSGGMLSAASPGEVLMRFDVPELPPGATLSGVELVWRNDAGPGTSNTLSVYEALGSWRESLVSWATRPVNRASALWSGSVGSTWPSSTTVPLTSVIGSGDPAVWPGQSVTLALTYTGTLPPLYARLDPLGRGPELVVTYVYNPDTTVPAASVLARRGQMLTMSAWTNALGALTGAIVEWSFADVDGDVIGSGTVTASGSGSPSGTCHSGTYTPPIDGVLTVRPVGTTRAVSGLRVHEGTPDGGFYAGRSTPCRIEVHDPGLTLKQWKSGGQGSGDYTVTLVEVGVPGEVSVRA